MEYYESKCPDCQALYRWVGYKTGLGKTPAQLEKMRRDQTVCRECGGPNLKTGLDHTSPEAQEYDEMLGGLLSQVLGVKKSGEPLGGE